MLNITPLHILSLKQVKNKHGNQLSSENQKNELHKSNNGLAELKTLPTGYRPSQITVKSHQ